MHSSSTHFPSLSSNIYHISIQSSIHQSSVHHPSLTSSSYLLSLSPGGAGPAGGGGDAAGKEPAPAGGEEGEGLKGRAYREGGACSDEVIFRQVIVKLSDQLSSCMANQEAASCFALKELQQEVENLKVRRTRTHIHTRSHTKTHTCAYFKAFPVHLVMWIVVNGPSRKTGSGSSGTAGGQHQVLSRECLYRMTFRPTRTRTAS